MTAKDCRTWATPGASAAADERVERVQLGAAFVDRGDDRRRRRAVRRGDAERIRQRRAGVGVAGGDGGEVAVIGHEQRRPDVELGVPRQPDDGQRTTRRLDDHVIADVEPERSILGATDGLVRSLWQSSRRERTGRAQALGLEADDRRVDQHVTRRHGERALPDQAGACHALRCSGQLLELRRQDAGLQRALPVRRVHRGRGADCVRRAPVNPRSRLFCNDCWNRMRNTSKPIATMRSPNRNLARRISLRARNISAYVRRNPTPQMSSCPATTGRSSPRRVRSSARSSR